MFERGAHPLGAAMARLFLLLFLTIIYHLVENFKGHIFVYIIIFNLNCTPINLAFSVTLLFSPKKAPKYHKPSFFKPFVYIITPDLYFKSSRGTPARLIASPIYPLNGVTLPSLGGLSPN